MVPTETPGIVKRDALYAQLHAVLCRLAKYDIVITMGGLNIKVGSGNTLLGDVMKKHGLSDRNDNGERLVNFSVPTASSLTTHRSSTTLGFNCPTQHEQLDQPHCNFGAASWMWVTRKSLTSPSKVITILRSPQRGAATPKFNVARSRLGELSG